MCSTTCIHSILRIKRYEDKIAGAWVQKRKTEQIGIQYSSLCTTWSKSE